jgi:hypothetical protein
MPGLLPLTDGERGQLLEDYGFTPLNWNLVDLAHLDDLSPIPNLGCPLPSPFHMIYGGDGSEHIERAVDIFPYSACGCVSL